MLTQDTEKNIATNQMIAHTKSVAVGAGLTLAMAGEMLTPHVAFAEEIVPQTDPTDEVGIEEEQEETTTPAQTVNDAEDALNEATDAANQADQAYQEKAEAAGEAEQAVKDAQDDYDEAQAAVEKTKEEAEQAVKGAQEEAQRQADEATAAHEQADADVETAQADADAAKATQESAEEEYEKAQQDVDAAKAASDEEAVEQLTADVAKAQDEYADAKAAQERAQSEVEKAEQDESVAKEAYDEAQKDATTAQEAAQTAQTGYEDAKKEAEEAARALEDAQSAVTAAESEKQAAEQSLHDAEEQQRKAQEAFEQANQANEDAIAKGQQVLETQRNPFTGGSVQFFEDQKSETAAGYLLNEDAVEATTNTTFFSHTDIGGTVDATSIDNMIEAVKWVIYCNEQRQKVAEELGIKLDDLLITDEMMASAQRNANFSTYYYEHAQGDQWFADHTGTIANPGDLTLVGENLYISVYGAKHAYSVWLWKEKELWEELVDNHPDLKKYQNDWGGLRQYYTDRGESVPNVGHYLALINPRYKFTGIGLNTTPISKLETGLYDCGAAVQHFRDTTYAESYTAEEYLERLLIWKASIEKQAAQDVSDAIKLQDETYQAGQEALRKKNEADDAVIDAQTRYSNAVADLEAAHTTLANQQTAYATLVATANAKKTEYETAQATAATKNEVLTQKSKAYEAAQQTTTEKKSTLAQADSDLANAETALSTARANLADKDAKLADALARLSEAKTALDEADAELTTAQSKLNQATALKKEAAAAEQEAKNKLARANALTADAALAGSITDEDFQDLNGFKTKLEKATDAVATAQQLLETAKTAKTEADAAVAAAYADYLEAVAEQAVAQDIFDRLVAEETQALIDRLTANFDPDGGTLSGAAVLRRIERNLYAIDLIPVPTKDGYVFTGWFDEDGNQVTGADGKTDTLIRLTENKAVYPMMLFAMSLRAPAAPATLSAASTNEIYASTVLTAGWELAPVATDDTGDPSATTGGTGAAPAGQTKGTGKVETAAAAGSDATTLTTSDVAGATQEEGTESSTGTQSAETKSTDDGTLPQTGDAMASGAVAAISASGVLALFAGLLGKSRRRRDEE